MIQRQQPHPAGTFVPCISCGREPKHIVCAGTARHETAPLGTTGERHQLECCRCHRTTARHAHLGAAETEWTLTHTDTTLRVVRRRAAA